MNASVWGKGNGSKALARALGVKRNRKADVVIRWRLTDRIPPASAKVFNSDVAIKRASDKLKSLKIMKEAGLNVPPFAERLEDLAPREGDIIFGRFRYHSKGDDIVAMEVKPNRNRYFLPKTEENVAKEQFLTKEYFVKWIRARAEYRYHVAFGKVILCTKKMLADGESEVNGLIKNHQDGTWKQVVCTETPRFSEACIKAVAAHGLDFGAVDFMNVNREAMILEVNTAPGVQVDNRLEAYVQAFQRKIED
jgi:glutathione synthase/RimK-type ligase-like ATP-grasp enzyme